jgi:hypothetical protein
MHSEMGNAPNLLFEAWITTDKTTPNLANQLPLRL